MLTTQWHRAGRTAVARMREPLTEASATILALPRQADGRVVVLDLTGVPFADSTGLRWLRGLDASLREAGQQLRLAVPEQGTLRRALALLGYDRELAVYPTARAAWRGRA